jgi:pectinesterase
MKQQRWKKRNKWRRRFSRNCRAFVSDACPAPFASATSLRKAAVKSSAQLPAAWLLAASLVAAACSRQVDRCRTIEADAIVAPADPTCFRTVQQAIDAAPTGQAKPFVISICPGVYKEKLRIPDTKGPIRLQGVDASTTVLTYDASAPAGAEGKFDTLPSASTAVYANQFEAQSITFENSAGPLNPAIAINVSADQAVFRRCQFRSWQDTLLAYRGRQYYEDCYVAGHVDFIFGAATAWFQHCELHCRDGGAVTAASTPAEQPYGFVFSGCKITADYHFRRTPRPDTLLGRPWGRYASVIYLNTKMAAIVAPSGWGDWDDVSRRKTVRFAEYRSTGAGAKPSLRVSFAKQLNDAEAGSVTLQNVFGDWHPKLSSGAPQGSHGRDLFQRR